MTHVGGLTKYCTHFMLVRLEARTVRGDQEWLTYIVIHHYRVTHDHTTFLLFCPGNTLKTIVNPIAWGIRGSGWIWTLEKGPHEGKFYQLEFRRATRALILAPAEDSRIEPCKKIKYCIYHLFDWLNFWSFNYLNV